MTPRNVHPYRFVFLDGCKTAEGNLPQAFGIPKATLTRDDFAKRGLRPRAFVGWDNAVTIAFATAPDLRHVRFIPNFFKEWQDPTIDPPRGLKAAIEAAAKDASGQVIFQEALDHLKIYGAVDLLFQE